MQTPKKSLADRIRQQGLPPELSELAALFSESRAEDPGFFRTENSSEWQQQRRALQDKVVGRNLQNEFTEHGFQTFAAGTGAAFRRIKSRVHRESSQ